MNCAEIRGAVVAAGEVNTDDLDEDEEDEDDFDDYDDFDDEFE